MDGCPDSLLRSKTMEPTQVEARTSSPALYVVVDFGARLALNDLAEYARSLSVIWRYTLLTEALARPIEPVGRNLRQACIEIQEQGLSFDDNAQTSLFLTSPIGEYRRQAKRLEDEVRFTVDALHMRSPWQALLTATSDYTEFGVYGAATIYSLRKILQLVMDWQKHRLEIREREVRLWIEMLAALGRGGDITGAGAYVLANFNDSFEPGSKPHNLIPPEESFASAEAVGKVARNAVQRADVVDRGTVNLDVLFQEPPTA